MEPIYGICVYSAPSEQRAQGFRRLWSALQRLPVLIDKAPVSLYDPSMLKESWHSKMAEDYLLYLLNHPDEHVAAIVRCLEIHADYIAEAEAVGLMVCRELRLITGLAVEGTSSGLLALAQSSWVLRIEPDEPIHTMS